MIKIEDLKHYYTDSDGNEVKALDGVDLTIEQGEFVAIIGANGSGKSTLARHLNCLLLPTAGRVEVSGLDTLDEKNMWDIRQQVGMVFQNPDNQIVAEVVEEDVAFGPENIGVPGPEIAPRVAKALAAVGMTEYAKHAPHRLSGGQKQRVAIAGIMALEPKCIVLDEPTAMLDPVGRRDVMETIERLNKEEGITIILITHYMDEAVRGDRVYVIDDGDLVMQGTPREIFVQVDKLKEYGLDVPQVTEVTYLLRKEGIDLPADILTIEEMVGVVCQLKSTI